MSVVVVGGGGGGGGGVFSGGGGYFCFLKAGWGVLSCKVNNLESNHLYTVYSESFGGAFIAAVQ